MALRFSAILCMIFLLSGLMGCVRYHRSPYGGDYGRQYDRDRDRDRDHDHDRDRDHDHNRDRDRNW